MTIDWFEIPVAELGRAVEFYGTVLGTELGEIPGPGGKPLKVFMGPGGPSGAVMSGEGYTPGSEGALIHLGCPSTREIGAPRIAGLLNWRGEQIDAGNVK